MRLILALLLGLSAGLPAAAGGQAAASPGQAAATVSLVDGWRAEDGSRIAAIVVRLAPGWHTYWRVPGEAGIPPRFDWSASTNLESVAYEWPRPKVFEIYGVRSFGYDGEMVLPVRLAPADPDAPMAVELAMEFGVCEEICMPVEAEVTARLGGGAVPEDRARIEAALASRAIAPEQAGVAEVTCALRPSGDGVELAAEVTFAKAPVPVPIAVFEADQPDLWVGETRTALDGRTLVARAAVEAAGGGGPMLERAALRLTLIEPARAVDIRGCDAD